MNDITPPERNAPRNLADIIALENSDWQQQLPAANTYALLQQAAGRHPERTALRFLLRGEADAPAVTLSYRGLFERVTQAANLFHSHGIGPGQAVALLLPNLPETHYALWGAQAAGIAAPINPMLDAEHIAGLIDATGATALVTLAPQPGNDSWDKTLAVLARCRSLRTVFLVDLDAYSEAAQRSAAQALRQSLRSPRPDLRLLPFGAELDAQPGGALLSGRCIAPDDACAYFHTGGTTGLPKVAVHSHRNEAYVAHMLAQLQPGRHVVLCGLPLFHVNGAMVTGLGAFHAGWQVVLLTPQGYRGPGVLPSFWRLVERFRATTFSGVPTIFAALAGLPVGGADISSLQVAFCGAAPLPPEVAARFEAVAGIPLCEGYGLTEAACISAVNPAGMARRPGSVGLRLPHQPLQAWQVDAAGRAVRPCAMGEMGVIGISGPNVFPGYLRERDNQGIWLKPGWLNTGDLGYVDQDGYLYLTGRAKDLIIRGGHNIDPLMIEAALQRHPAVAQAAAVGQPDAHAGELPAAYVVLKPGQSATPADLLEAARALVPERAAAPVRVVVLPQLPLTAVGKLAKAELRLRAAEHVFQSLLTEHGLPARLEMVQDGARGSVVRLHCAPGMEAQARRLLAPFPYPVDVVACDAGEPA